MRLIFVVADFVVVVFVWFVLKTMDHFFYGGSCKTAWHSGCGVASVRCSLIQISKGGEQISKKL